MNQPLPSSLVCPLLILNVNLSEEPSQSSLCQGRSGLSSVTLGQFGWTSLLAPPGKLKSSRIILNFVFLVNKEVNWQCEPSRDTVWCLTTHKMRRYQHNLCVKVYCLSFIFIKHQTRQHPLNEIVNINVVLLELEPHQGQGRCQSYCHDDIEPHIAHLSINTQ